jgi:hypothetical protein
LKLATTNTLVYGVWISGVEEQNWSQRKGRTLMMMTMTMMMAFRKYLTYIPEKYEI